MLVFILQFFLSIVVSFFAIYVICEWCSLYSKKTKGVKKDIYPKNNKALSPEDINLPKVSILLPIYNERIVLEKLLYAVSNLQYPLKKFDIWLLDDSTDTTSQLAQKLVNDYKKHGIPIHYASRGHRKGFKAGNLNFGLNLAQGEFIAIFDADCLPPKDFLLKTIPYFSNNKVGYLQTSVQYSNRNKSFLTRFQAMLATHKEYITEGQELQNAMSSLTGSSCLWRRACIDAIGGIQDATISEDMDMGLRAQLCAWKYIFVPYVTSQAELPETIAAFRVQRERWGRGHIQNSLRHAKGIIKNNMSIKAHMQAFSMLFASFLLSSFYIIMLLCLPFTFLSNDLGIFFHILCTMFLLTTIFWIGAMLVSKKLDEKEKTTQISPNKEDRTSKKSSIGIIYASVLLFFPLSLYYFYALVYVLLGRQGNFNRTPKQKRLMRHPKLNNRLIALEFFSFLYSIVTFLCSLYFANYWIALYTFLTLLGFGLVIALTWYDRPLKNHTIIRQTNNIEEKMKVSKLKEFLLHLRLAFLGHPKKKTENNIKNKKEPSHILITGAGGVIGSALALEYAKPNIHLTLHARNAEKLKKLLEECKVKGASVDIATCNLEDKDAMLQWITNIKNTALPDLIIANAGLITIADDAHGSEPFEEAERLVNVNLLSTMRLIDAFLPTFRERGYGQIAIMSSLGGYFGIPSTPTYCATKSALRVYGDAMRAFLKNDNIKINVILPGYVRSHMVDTIPTPTPEIFIVEPPRAACIIKKGLDKNRAHITFPFPFSVGAWFMSVLPACISIPIARIITRAK